MRLSWQGWGEVCGGPAEGHTASHGLQQCRKEKSERLRDPEITNVRAGRSLPRHHLSSSVQMRSRAREGWRLSKVTPKAGAGLRSQLPGLQYSRCRACGQAGRAGRGCPFHMGVQRAAGKSPARLTPDRPSVDSQVLGLGAYPDENHLETFAPAGG